MRNFTLWLCFCVLSLAQVSVSYAAASEQEMVQDGRDLAFNGGVPTIAGLVAADQEFQDILAINSSNQQALFFRAITRVLVSVAEQGSGLLPIPNLMGAFGFFWNDAPISDPATPTGTDFLTSLDASIADLTRLIGLIAIDDQFTLTLRRTQVGSLQVNVGPDDVRVLKDMMVTVSDFMNLNAWDILDLKQLIINDTMGLLTEEQRTLLYKFVTPFGYSTIPSAPTAVSATAGNLQATVGFAAPVNDGGSAITGYTVTSNPAGGVDSNDGMIATTHTVTGLTNGTEYTFTVKATNAVGDSLDSAASKATPRTVPGAPTIGTATPGNAQATVSFTAPASNGGSAITGYTVTSSPAGGVDSNAGTIATTHTVTGLTNGTAYTFTVKATNVAGDSAASTASSSVTPRTVPGAPTVGTATPGNAQATLSFTAPASNGGSAITGYTVTSSPAGGVDSNAGTIATTHTVTGLTNGTAYTFTVKATNVAGDSAASAASNSVTPRTVPGAPTIGTATAGNVQAIVSFTAPASNGGSAITGYTVTSSPGGVDSNAGTIATAHTVTGLTNGTEYTFTVKATNAVGDSLDSAASKATPRTVPGAPTIGTATPGNAQATVSFTAPASNGGSAITGYMVTSSPAGGVDSNAGTIATPHTVTGLTNGTAYTFTVKATNVAGDSAASTASSSVMPLLIAAPASITVPTSDADGAYTVSWVTSTTAGVTYVLQESTNNSTFTTISPTVRTSGSIVSASITGRLTGRTYYYRVKATKTGYTDSDWRTGSNSCPVPGTLTSGVPASIAVPVSDADGAYSVSWGAALATTGVTYVLEEATNSTFTTGLRTAYTGTALTSPISGRSQDTTYYYRVKAIKPGLKDSAWRTGSNSCPVPGALTSGDPASIAVPVSDADGAYSVSWDAALATTEVTYVLEEATNSTFTAGRRTAYSGPALTSPISGRLQNTTYYYRVKAIKPGLKDSAWRTGNNSCPVPGTTTVATPPSLTFTAIILHGFTVNWGASTTIGVTYILEEATNSAFTAGLRTAYTGTARLVKITGRTKGVTYYYRVRAIKAGAKDSAKRTGSKVAT